MEPAIAWVVLTGIPNNAIEVKMAPPAVSAKKQQFQQTSYKNKIQAKELLFNRFLKKFFLFLRVHERQPIPVVMSTKRMFTTFRKSSWRIRNPKYCYATHWTRYLFSSHQYLLNLYDIEAMKLEVKTDIDAAAETHASVDGEMLKEDHMFRVRKAQFDLVVPRASLSIIEI